MARRPRIHYPGAFYHVIARGNQKQDIFLKKEDYKTCLTYLSECKAKYHFYLYAYALMRNHFHLLVEVKEVPLSKVMQVVQFRYTQYFNKRYGKVGHLFQGRYKAILCEKDSYLLELVRYIHLNPVRAKVVTDPEKYLWTSHQIYLNRTKSELVDQDLVLAQFSQRKAMAQQAYKRFVLQELQGKHEEKYYQVKDQRYLGDEKFIEQIEGKKIEPIVYDISLEDIVSEVSKITGIHQDRLYSLTRDRRGAYGRGLVAYLARKVSGCLVKDIASHFHREAITISEAIIKIENQIQRDKEVEKMIKVIKNHLIKNRKRKYRISVA